MDTYARFLYEYLSQVHQGMRTVAVGFIEGVKTMFDIGTYRKIIEHYKQDFSIPEWILVALAILMLVAIVGITIAILVIIFRKYTGLKKKVMDQEELLKEVNTLNNQVTNLVKEKEEILAMKVSRTWA